MIASVWNNGSYDQSGGGYGFKIIKQDRDNFFNPDWKNVFLKLDGQDNIVDVNIGKDSFCDGCSELIHKEIGLWLIKNSQNKWPKGTPPKVNLESLGERQFSVSLIS